MKQQVSWGGKLKSYLEWPIFVIVLLLIMDVAVFACSKQAGLVALIFTCIYLVIVVALFFVYKPSVMKELVSSPQNTGRYSARCWKNSVFLMAFWISMARQSG